MKEIQGAELKKIELDLLVKVDNICRENGWNYSLCGGTLLGAIRHKGFIPWDDDIDIAIPREDYESFLNYVIEYGHEQNIKVVSTRTSKSYAYLAAKVCDTDTVMIEDGFDRDDSEMGVYVDIFPIDGLGQEAVAKKHFRAMRFERELLVAKNWKRFFRSKTHAWYVEPIRFAFWIMSRFVSTPKLTCRVESYYAQFPLKTSEYAAVVCGSYREKEILPTKVLNTFTELEFEGRKFMAFNEYDVYLRSIYGNYMKLPSEEKRITHHMFKAYRKD